VWEFYSRGAILDAADVRMTGEFDAREMVAPTSSSVATGGSSSNGTTASAPEKLVLVPK
jgi:hypothetical protein